MKVTYSINKQPHNRPTIQIGRNNENIGSINIQQTLSVIITTDKKNKENVHNRIANQRKALLNGSKQKTGDCSVIVLVM